MEITEKRTAEETLEWLQKYDKHCDEEIQRVKEAFRKRKGLALDKWAYDNARFHRADIIESRGTIILVDSRRGHKKMYANELYVEYRGPQLTRKLEPRKDGQITSIYDDEHFVRSWKNVEPKTEKYNWSGLFHYIGVLLKAMFGIK